MVRVLVDNSIEIEIHPPFHLSAVTELFILGARNSFDT